MRILKIFEKKPLKRIELKAHSKNSKFRVRASRTSGVNAALHPLRGLTFNTKYGMRVSKTFKGLTLGFQGGNSVVRGRWSSENGLLNLNLSKSGFSLSSKSKFGTYNISNPNRSSFKFAGIQLRGKKAAGPALFFTILTLIPVLVKGIFDLLVFTFHAVSFLSILSINTLIIIFRVFSVIYNFCLLLLIDIPKQLLNRLFKRDIFDFTGKDEIKIDHNELLKNDEETINILQERLENYGRTYLDIGLLEKVFKYFLAFLGINFMVSGGIIIISYLISYKEFIFSEFAWMVIFSLLLVGVGKLALKPLIKLRRHREDYEFKQILGL
mgnify:CR=1 FL=1